MSDDYLWDRTGAADPDVVHLERVLAKLGLRNERPRPRRSRRPLWVGAIAALLMVGIGIAILMRRPQTIGPVTPWQLSLSGETPRAVRTGEAIETGAVHATMESAFVGQVEVEPDSRLRLLATRGDEQRLALDHGTIHAFIWAPPARFIVDTPAAKTIDLGCQYTLQVGKDGTGFLTVELGWVAFQWRGIESFIPAGAACHTRPGHGPDTPYFLDAPTAFKSAVARFDSHPTLEALDTALAGARPRDGLTLWHLLQRTDGRERARVFDRFAALVDLPPNVSREAILHSDRKSMDEAWNALRLGDTSWWRDWKRQW
jgi:hypothetical protein